MGKTSHPAWGAWIEVSPFLFFRKSYIVAPREGAWIEVSLLLIILSLNLVAPRMGCVN